MKVKLILFFLVTLVLEMGCKKYGNGYNNPSTQPPAPAEKKWVITTAAGDGTALFADGPALTARFKNPLDVTVTADGIIYVADGLNHRIRKIAGGQVTTLAGFGIQDTTSGIGTAAGFACPIQVTAGMGGNLYTLDVNDFRVRKITPAALVTVAAGNGIRGFADGRADAAMFGESYGIVTDNDENIYVSDWENRRIRKISVTGQVTTIAGPMHFGPGGIAIDTHGNLYVVDQGSFQIRKITPAGDVSIFAGNGTPGDMDGNPGEAQFGFDMRDIVADDQGNLYLSDADRIRKITPQGIVSTIAGSGFGYRDGDGIAAKFNSPNGLGIDAHGNLYVADENNNRIRKINFE